MNKIEQIISTSAAKGLKMLYQKEVDEALITVQQTKKEFDGDYTVVIFPLVKIIGKSPELIGNELGKAIIEANEIFETFNVVKGFLNFVVKKSFFLSSLNQIVDNKDFGFVKEHEKSPLMMIEFSSPNTNKPLHLGHIRNNLLGESISNIQKANGYKIVKTNIINDRGIHICKSMLAWKQFSNGETPQSSNMKGDFFVGKYYVIFDREYKKQITNLISKGSSEEEAKKNAPLILDAQKMLKLWEDNNQEIKDLWYKMNGWVYEGFDETYKKLGISFDSIYYESQTYIIGKQEVEHGLAKGIFYKKPDGSVWVDLTADGLDEKLLLRSDGTSVYMTQDIGTAKLRYSDFPIDKMVYVVGNEQNYHFQVLSIVLDKLGFEWGKSLVHFSYGMVELPEGKMKSREGTVVDADDLIDEMEQTAYQTTKELGKFNDFSDEELKKLSKIIGLGALKYFILKVDPQKNMVFNPKESIDFNGNSAPFIQYTHARIKSILRKAEEDKIELGICDNSLNICDKEKLLIQILMQFQNIVCEAGANFSPALVANYCYDLAKEFNQFYHDYSILKEENPKLKKFRVNLCYSVAFVLKQAMGLLGIELPEKM
ncbi:MAG: arginine--tRNA ligase [Prevotellaceae bacterium]|jgi:arginyl-tRNA synthetase|nr:arginine--tRNA ligase [Prevotellaceae bacterium]